MPETESEVGHVTIDGKRYEVIGATPMQQLRLENEALKAEVERLRAVLTAVLPDTPYELVPITDTVTKSLCRFCRAAWPDHMAGCMWVEGRRGMGIDPPEETA